MCGRFSQFYTWAEIRAFSRPLVVETPSNLPPQYNIAPTDQAGVIWKGEDGRWHYEVMRWGLIPRWWSRPIKGMAPMHNARAEEVDTKPAFRDAFKHTRCLVSASGFFEWTGDRRARKSHFISSTDNQPLMFAGLYDRWKNRVTGEVISSFTIIVTDANPFMGEIHDRMPVILAEENWDAWLDAPRKDLLVPASDADLQRWRVTEKMNASTYKEADSVEPIPE